MMQQPGTTLVPPQMAPPTVPHQQNHFQYQQQQQPWMMPNHHHQQPPQQPFQYLQPHQPPLYYHQQQPPPQVAQSQFPASSDEVRTLWIGDLQYWMDEQYLVNCFAQIGEVVTAKVICNKQTAQSEGYGFIEFGNHAAAERTLQTYNGTLMPNVEQNYRLNWASFGAGEKRSDGTPDFTIFVGDLASDVTDYTLWVCQNTQGTQDEADPNNTTIFVGGVNESVLDDQLRQVFSPYGQLVHVKIPAGKRCGFVQFADRHCAEEALLRMLNGTQLGGQKIRLSWGCSPSSNSLSQIQTSGMVDIMDIHLDMKLMDMPQLLKIRICTTETILDMETTSNPPSSSIVYFWFIWLQKMVAAD